MNNSTQELNSSAAAAKYAAIRTPINAMYVTLNQQTPAANRPFDIPASTLLGWSVDVLRWAQRIEPARTASHEDTAHVVHFTLKDHTKAACKRVLDTLVYYGFRIMRQTKRGGVITAVVRYCAGNIAEALGELTKILPIAPDIRSSPFKLA
ncbi:hypothetical protein LL998_10870 [Burkholderia ambifaria]|uniref:hypothetical protein n=1 Tax=Burkholderia ambifaria TaxID=152480 RepID=UPI001E289829|nr:hypothetical protein [Burkholderia ambifaria]UEP33716.1 hypothetical protein LL998_10870 [Burkholderia ambifaria]